MILQMLHAAYHIRKCCETSWHFQCNVKCGFERWFIPTWKATSSICWLKLGNCCMFNSTILSENKKILYCYLKILTIFHKQHKIFDMEL